MEEEVIAFTSDLSDEFLAEDLGIPISSVRQRRTNAAHYLSKGIIEPHDIAKQTKEVIDRRYSLELAGKPVLVLLMNALLELTEKLA